MGGIVASKFKQDSIGNVLIEVLEGNTFTFDNGGGTIANAVKVGRPTRPKVIVAGHENAHLSTCLQLLFGVDLAQVIDTKIVA